MFQRHPIQNQHMMFVTTNIYNRIPVFANPAHARMATETLYDIQKEYPFFLYAFAIMPDHCHFLMHVPEHGSISKIMYQYKRAVSFHVGKPIWQSRFHLKIIQMQELFCVTFIITL
jgi:putative transposase